MPWACGVGPVLAGTGPGRCPGSEQKAAGARGGGSVCIAEWRTAAVRWARGAEPCASSEGLWSAFPTGNDTVETAEGVCSHGACNFIYGRTHTCMHARSVLTCAGSRRTDGQRVWGLCCRGHGACPRTQPPRLAYVLLV